MRLSELPDLFRFSDGRLVKSRQDWQLRRTELQKLIQDFEYGRFPPAPAKTEGELLMRNWVAPQKCRQLLYRIWTGDDRKLSFLLNLFLPEGDGPFPVVLNGDACWPEMTPDKLRAILERKYILAHFNRLEFASDNKLLGRKDGLYALFPEGNFGALAAWAWGHSRAIDFLVTQPVVNAKQIAAVGASRGGKTVLLAAAMDERIALSAPNDSGCCGAGCFRFQGPESETLKEMLENTAFWLTPKLAEFLGREKDLPFDQHAVKALVAPRLLFSTEALGDLYANPTGTWLTHLAAREVYRFLGVEEKIGIAYRPGAHAHMLEDWHAFLDFADFHFRGMPTARNFNACPFPELPAAWNPDLEVTPATRAEKSPS